MDLVGDLQTERILDFTHIRIDQHDLDLGIVYRV